MIRAGDVSTSGTPYVDSFLRARIDPTPANIERAIAEARSWYAQAPTTIYHFVQVLGTFGRKEELFSILLNWSAVPCASRGFSATGKRISLPLSRLIMI